MSIREICFLVFAVLGGLALFIFGMNMMTDGLRLTAGPGLRTNLFRATRSRLAGISLGTCLGTLIHSSATTVMIVGFINAGLISLEESVAPMLGANIGTTISMQAISFKLGDYRFVAIVLGFLLQMLAPRPRVKACGSALMGFGLLFLGMNTMSDAIRPHRDTLAPILGGIRGDNLQNLLAGVGISAGLTGIWQSSGATVMICYALASAGVFTELHQVYPIVLGAHVGTCATALLSSIGTDIEARRFAVSHLLFNIMNVAMAIAARPFFFWLIPLTSTDLIRQTANLHTSVMVIAAVLVLPLSLFYARLVRLVVPSRKPPTQPSFLEPQLLRYPERAIVAAIRELQRVARICAQSFHSAAHVLLRQHKPGTVQAIKLNEKKVNELKLAMRDYLSTMTTHYLSRRQTILIQHLNRCMTEIERIGDHIDEFCDVSLRRAEVREAWLDEESLKWLFELYEAADNVLRLVIVSLDPAREDFQRMAEQIMEARNTYMRRSMQAKSDFTEKIVGKSVTPIGAMFFTEYVAILDRIVKHSKSIALAEKHPDFWIKRKKLRRAAEGPLPFEPSAPVDGRDWLDQLQKEDYL